VSCEELQEQLTERVFARGAPALEAWDPALRSHVAACAACAAHLRFVRALVADLEAAPVEAPGPGVLAAAQQRALRALRARSAPRGLLRELALALAVTLLAWPVAVAQAWLVAEGASALLAPLLPHLVLIGLGVVYFGSLALALGALYALLPLWVAIVRQGHAEAS
jgi:hypothetical protein